VHGVDGGGVVEALAAGFCGGGLVGAVVGVADFASLHVECSELEDFVTSRRCSGIWTQAYTSPQTSPYR
jgi:hypothetical protein